MNLTYQFKLNQTICGLVMDRDYNVVINILNRYIK